MKSFFVPIFLFFVFSLVTSFPTKPLKIESCGGTFNATSGEISYKLYEPFAPNERCVWIIRTRNATDYSIGVFSLGFPAPHPNQQVTIAGFAHRRNVTEIVPSQAGLYNLNNCSLLVITFHSGPSNTFNYTGFSLQFSSFHNGGVSEPSFSSNDVVIDSDDGYLRYPLSGTSYANLELTTLLFLQSNRVHNPDEKINIVYMLNSLEGSCNDFLKVYLFNIHEPQKWEYSQQLCSTTTNAIISNRDMILLIFETDSSTTGSGFHFTHSRCIKEEKVTTPEAETTTEEYWGSESTTPYPWY